MAQAEQQTAELRTVTLTGRRPVRINEDVWPLIACGSDKDWQGEFERQASRKWSARINVRQHADGRTLVYGTALFETVYQGERNTSSKAGFLLDSPDDVVGTIRQVRAELESFCSHEYLAVVANAANECIADLPAEEI